jgi:short-subunit dehydrogenase
VKPGVLVTSSGLGSIPIAGFLTYSATKSFATFIAEGLNFELKGKVDVISYQAGEVTTKMLKRRNTDSRTITPERAADCSLRDLGSMPMTYGSFRHEVNMFMFSAVPLVWI